MISVGIHIDLYGFSIVELSLDKSSLKIINSYNHVFDSQTKEESKQIVIVEYLQALEEKYKNQPVRFCYGLSQSQVSSFSIAFPFTEKFKILKTLPFQIEDKSPFRSDKIFYDGRITKTKGNNSCVICFVTPESNVHDFLQFSKPLKTKPYLLSVEGAALANVISGWNYDSSKKIKGVKNSFYIYLGFQESVVLVFKEGYLDSVSNIEWGGSSIVEQMAQKYNLSFEQSASQFFEKSFVLTTKKEFAKEQIFFSDLIKKELAPLMHKLKLLKLSLETENKIRFEDNVIFGPASVVKNLSAYLSTETSSNFSRLKELKDLKDFNLAEATNQKLLPSLGLAMEGLKRLPYGGVNLLQSLHKQSSLLFPKKWKPVFMSSVAVLLVFSAYVFIRNQESQKLSDQIHSTFVDYGKKIAFIRESQVSVEKVQEFLDSKESSLEVENLIKEKVSQYSAIHQLKILTEAINVEESWLLRITYLKIKGQSVSIKGQISKEGLLILKSRLQTLSKNNRVQELKDDSIKGGKEKLSQLKDDSIKGDKEKLSQLKDDSIKGDKEKLSQLKGTFLKEDQKMSDLQEFSYQFVIKEST